MTTATPLLSRTTCPHCWHQFAPEEVLWVSCHADLLGDARLGTEQQARFLPTRYDLRGAALDARGMPCSQLACPHCHLAVPRGLLEMEPYFVSILGAPGCGKSYLLAAMTWQLRQDLTQSFALTFQDADPVANAPLNAYEQALFLGADGERLVPLADLIRKTELQGHLYDNVMFGNQTVSYPKPFLFSMAPLDRHPNAAARARLARLLCLYDNAGEHFQPGADSTQNQATRHLARSRLLLFLFDPTQDRRFLDACKRAGTEAIPAPFAGRQEVVLNEVAARVRRFTDLASSERHPHPLLVLVTKYDVWARLIPERLGGTPWVNTRRGVTVLDVGRIEQWSQQVKRVLEWTCPEIVAAAEGFASQVLYLPVSAIGARPVTDPQTGQQATRLRNVKPLWAAVPLLYGLARTQRGLIPLPKPAAMSAPTPEPEEKATPTDWWDGGPSGGAP